jgi:hypothetical protein
MVQAVSVEDPDSAASLASLGAWADALGHVSSNRNGPRLTAPSTTSWSAWLVLCAMFANVLPGLREVRAPVVWGTLVLASLFIALALPSTPSRMTTRSSRAPSGFHPHRHQKLPSHPSRFAHRHSSISPARALSELSRYTEQVPLVAGGREPQEHIAQGASRIASPQDRHPEETARETKDTMTRQTRPVMIDVGNDWGRKCLANRTQPWPRRWSQRSLR